MNTKLEKSNLDKSGLTGKWVWENPEIQAVCEVFPIWWQAVGELDLTDALAESDFGIQVVKFRNGATIYSYIAHESYTPTYKTLTEVSRMAGVKRVGYFLKDGTMKWRGEM